MTKRVYCYLALETPGRVVFLAVSHPFSGALSRGRSHRCASRARKPTLANCANELARVRRHSRFNREAD
jgi:hypothetical protein